MRLFLAIEIDEHVREAARHLTGELERLFERAGAGGRVRWVPPANLHVTLKFLGDVDEALGARVREAMAAPLPVAGFEMRLAGAGVFPPAGPPRVVWVGLAASTSQTADLHRRVEARLVPLGVPADDRPYSAHLTLGRFREGPRRLPGDLRKTLMGVEADLGRCRVDRVTLFESRLSPRGPTYVALAQAPLAGAASPSGAGPPDV